VHCHRRLYNSICVASTEATQPLLRNKSRFHVCIRVTCDACCTLTRSCPCLERSPATQPQALRGSRDLCVLQKCGFRGYQVNQQLYNASPEVCLDVFFSDRQRECASPAGPRSSHSPDVVRASILSELDAYAFMRKVQQVGSPLLFSHACAQRTHVALQSCMPTLHLCARAVSLWRLCACCASALVWL
jgi:hypothetical protein